MNLHECIGLQFHPEAAVRKYLNMEENAEKFMDYDTAAAFFEALVRAAE